MENNLFTEDIVHVIPKRNSQSGVKGVRLHRYAIKRQRVQLGTMRRKEDAQHRLTTQLKPLVPCLWEFRDRRDQHNPNRKERRGTFTTCFLHARHLAGDLAELPENCGACEQFLNTLAMHQTATDEYVPLTGDWIEEKRDAYQDASTCDGFRKLVDVALMDTPTDFLKPVTKDTLLVIAGRGDEISARNDAERKRKAEADRRHREEQVNEMESDPLSFVRFYCDKGVSLHALLSLKASTPWGRLVTAKQIKDTYNESTAS